MKEPAADFTDADVRALASHGIPIEEARRHLELFRNPPPFAQLDRACTLGDGIVAIRETDHRDLLARHATLADTGRLTKFVPASGAASRMFKTLLAQWADESARTRADLEAHARGGDEAARDTLLFLDEIDRFAFTTETMRKAAQKGDHRTVLKLLLSDQGLGYGTSPKGLIAFHRYPDGVRTPFEEHLVEAAGQIRDRNGECRVHLTISPEHREGFEALAARTVARHEKSLGARFAIEYSTQDPSTDTLAAGSDDRPFRLSDGTLLLRPGGHGALLKNLDRLDADVVLIKNIDNVVMDHSKNATQLWKRLIVGLFARLESEIAELARRLESGDESAAGAAILFIERELGQDVDSLRGGHGDALRANLLARLDRPLRIAGVVRNTGEPGGGPYWVRGADGSVTAQIVEGSQIDPESPEQQTIRASATHFNPVDLVCGLRDRHGRKWPLADFVDPRTVFISRKSQSGRAIKALELPGLWNGAMAHWNTVFVEVPIETFAPVKTVFDLLRDEHQPR